MSSASREPKPNVPVRCMAWNDNGTALAIGTSQGFTIYSTEPVVSSQGGALGGMTAHNLSSTGVPISGNGGYLTEVCSRKVSGGVAHIALYRQSNMVLFAGSATTTDSNSTGGNEGDAADPATQVTLWNDALMTEPMGSIAAAHGLSVEARSGVVATIQLQTPVVAMRLHPSCVVVAEEATIHVLGEHLTLLESYSTPVSMMAATPGAVGVRGLSINDNSISLATFVHPHATCLGMLFLGPSTGTVRCCLLYESMQEQGRAASAGGGTASPPPVMVKQQRIKSAGVLTPHQRPIRCLCITADGSKGATISENGTAVKLIDVLKGVVLTQFNRGSTSSAVFTMAFNPEGTLFSCLSDSGTLHFYAVGGNAADSGGGGKEAAGAGSGTLSGKTSNPKSKLGSWGSTAMSYAPGVISGSKLVSNASNYVNSEYSFATFSLSSSGGNTVQDDIENERSDTFSSTFAAISLCPGMVGRSGRGSSYAAVFAAQGNNEDAVDEEEAGQVVGFSGPRCKLVKVGLDLGSKQSERLSTNYFPREEL